METPSPVPSASESHTKSSGFPGLAFHLLRGGVVGTLSLALLGVKFAGGVLELGIKAIKKIPGPGSNSNA